MCLQGTEDHRAWSAYGWLGRLSPSEPVQGQLEHDIVQDELPCFSAPLTKNPLCEGLTLGT